MSLITLSSNDSLKPYLYSSHFPQPILIPAGSQVCCLKFIHFRDENEYLVNNLTDTLYFILGNKQNDGKRKVVLTHGSYTGADLATEIARALNASLQQQNYLWSCAYDALRDVFTISYASQPTPSATGGTWTEYIGDTNIFEVRNNDTVGGHTLLIPKTLAEGTNPTEATAFLPKGVLIHQGTYESEAIQLEYVSGTFVDPIPISFATQTIGIVRDVLSLPFPQNPNPNSAFEPDRQDVEIVLSGENGIEITSLDQSAVQDPNNINYVSPRVMRRVLQTAMDNLTGVGTKTQLYNAMFKFKLTVLGGASSAVIAQMFVSTDRGATYTAAATTTNDASGNPFFRSYTRGTDTYTGTFWVSDQASFNDNGKQKVNILATKRCPYVPTYTFTQTQKTYSFPELVSGITTPTWTGSSPADTYTMSVYSGGNDYAYVATGASNTYYLRVAGNDILTFALSASDTASPTLGSAEVHADAGGMTISYPGGGSDNWDFNGDKAELSMKSTDPQIQVSGIFNPESRPVSTQLHTQDMNVADSELVQDDSASLVGADISKKYWMFMKRLTQEDVAKGTTQTPIKLGEPSGNIGTLLGANENLYTGTSSTGGDTFVSNGSPNKTGKSTTLHISIPELPVKSFEGGYNNTGKNIAVLPREEFKSQGANGGQLVYVSDFENWVDIQSVTDLYVNQFSVEVRNPDGSLATDLLPDTTLQVKIREDPLRKQSKAMDSLLKAMSGTKVFTQEIVNTGS